MSQVRTTFSLPFKVPKGSDVYNQLGQSVGFVVNIDDSPAEDAAGNYRWFITADVDEKWAKEKLQCMEPTVHAR